MLTKYSGLCHHRHMIMKVLSFISYSLKKIRSFFPRALPKGGAEFDAWADDVISLAEAPNNDSVKFALATMILHMPESAAYRSNHSFVLKLKKSMSNQVAAAKMHEYKDKQAAALAAAQAKPTEATVLSVVSDAPQGQ